MDFTTELARSSLDPSLKSWVNSQLTELKNAQLKIQALTLELAYHKRLKFGVKSESLSVEQRELFEQSYGEDAAALEAEIDQLSLPSPRTRHAPTGRKPLPASLPRIEHRHEANRTGVSGAPAP